MGDPKNEPKRQIGAMELISICGFAFFSGWMFISFYWLFAVFLPDAPIAERDGIQLFVFLGITLGYLALQLASKNAKFVPFGLPMIIAAIVLMMPLPLAAVALSLGATIVAPLLCVVNLLAGLGGALITVCWLDVCGRINVRSYSRFTSLSLFGGGLLFALVTVMPQIMQPIFCMLYGLASLALLVFSSSRADRNNDAPPATSQADSWKFAKEIVPSLIAFGIVFGLTFVYLFNYGANTVLIGLLFVLPGSGAIVVFSHFGKSITITTIQRFLLCVCVLSCLAMPFTEGVIQLVCAGLVVASWAAFTPVNYAILVKKSVAEWNTPTFRQIPRRLTSSALGFFIGWAIATCVTFVDGSHSTMFYTVRLVMAVILVIVMMLFFPISKHHDGSDLAEGREVQPVVASSLTESELFEARCNAAAALYQLSPRETDILQFLARGRNAAYIQNKLTISPHTVKSHIYSIYRKMDIHSQQKLMDFIEEFPLDQKNGHLE